MSDGFLSLPEVARLLGVSRTAVFGAVRRGVLPAERVGRAWAVRREDVGRYAPKAYPRTSVKT